MIRRYQDPPNKSMHRSMTIQKKSISQPQNTRGGNHLFHRIPPGRGWACQQKMTSGDCCEPELETHVPKPRGREVKEEGEEGEEEEEETKIL